jgi:hypothetical protein
MIVLTQVQRVVASTSPEKHFTSSYQDPSSDQCLRDISSWLNQCVAEHPQCPSNLSSPLPTRILSVSEGSIKLVEPNGEMKAPYVALSHCWGSGSIATTTLANFLSRKKDVTWRELSKTFQDAVKISRLLGIDYLWIDSLCIIQDSEADWERESARMASVYANAHLTIAASRSADGSGGCFSALAKAPYIWRTLNGKLVRIYRSVRAQDGRKQDWVSRHEHWRPKTLSSLIQHDHDNDATRPAGKTKAFWISCAFLALKNPNLWEPFGIEHPIAPLSPEGSSKGSFWMSLLPSHDILNDDEEGDARKGSSHGLPLLNRAWFLQERILSTRVLHFGSAELYWECRNGIQCECSKENARETEKAGVRTIYSSLLREDENRENHENHDRLRRKAWQMLIEQYSRLELTREKDRLPALSGIAEGQTGAYLAGLWLEHFPQSLYWTPGMKDYRIIRRPIAYRAPSFSWASLEGPIDYHMKAWKESSDTGHVLAKVVDWSCIPEGLDPRGCVLDGHLQLSGWLGTATVSAVRLRSTTTACEITVDDLSQTFTLDVPLTLCNIEPAEVRPGDSVTLLLLECEKKSGMAYSLCSYECAALVLRSSKRHPGAFERVGLIWDDQELALQIGYNEGADMFRVAPKWFSSKGEIKIV